MSGSGGSTRRGGRPSAARALVLLAALVGLFAMHGLSDHGAMHHGEMAQGAFADLSTDTTMAGAPHRDETSPRPALVDTSSARLVVHGAAPHVMEGAMGLCLAVLAGVLLLREPRAPGTSLQIGPHQAWLRQLVPTARDPDPPDLIDLSIHRC